MSNIKWSSFANQHAMVTVISLLLGGLISIIGKFNWWPVGIYAIIIGVLIFIFEYPRSSRPPNSQNLTQTTPERPYQYLIGNLFAKFGLFYSNYFPRFIIYLALSIPCLLTLSTIIPALNLIITSCLYLLSNFKKEKWIQIEKKQEVYKSITVIKSPERPPPRSINELE